VLGVIVAAGFSRDLGSRPHADGTGGETQHPVTPRQVYVLGEVNRPGPAILSPQTTSLRAISSAGGFTAQAWRGRVLIVRNSSSEAKAIAVNLGDVLAGRAPDVALEAQDLLYVSARPWWKTADLVEEAESALARASGETAGNSPSTALR